MEISKATVFDNFTILMNSDIPNTAWESEIRKIDPSYVPDTNWPTNKTIIYNYRMRDACVLPLNVLLKEAVLVVPASFDIAPVIDSLISYLTCTIKTVCPSHVAKEMGFRLTVYMSVTHKCIAMLNRHRYFSRHHNMSQIGVLDEVLPHHMARYELVFKFDHNWNVVENKTIIMPLSSEPVHIGPCFRPMTEITFPPQYSNTFFR